MTDRFTDFTSTPTLYSVIKAFQQETFAKLNCMKIGVIDEILENNTVRCSITNKKLIRTNDDGTSVWRNYPPIYAKVYFMGSRDTGINYPLSVGSPCLLFFNDREFNSYFETGEISPLADTRMHSLTDCIAVPLYRIENNKDLNINSLSIKINGNEIKLTSDTKIILNSPDVETTGNLNIATGYSGIVPCGSATLTITNGIITGVS